MNPKLYTKISDRISVVRIMGVLNITPDSFSDGGVHFNLDDAVSEAERMLGAGADILDIGGESTRPGAEPVSPEQELRRVLPVIESVHRKIPDAVISIDTYKSDVARQALESGVTWVNDISGGMFSPDMFDIVAQKGATMVISHIKGAPRNMQKNPHYQDVVAEICEFLTLQTRKALDAGISADKIIIDPGIGFGKRYEDNLKILKNLDKLKVLGYPLLIGTSRKSFIGHYTGEPDASHRDPASYVTFLWSAAMGADILRVHNVPGTMQVLKMAQVIGNQ